MEILQNMWKGLAALPKLSCEHLQMQSFVVVVWLTVKRCCSLWLYLSPCLQEGMHQTLSSTSMFTPCGFSPHHLHPSKEDNEGGLIFQDGNLTSASLDALVQHLTPTADYYPEVSTWGVEAIFLY